MHSSLHGLQAEDRKVLHQRPSNWAWSERSRSPVLIIEALRGPAGATRVWDPADGQTRLLPGSDLLPLARAPVASPHTLATIASAARISDAISRNVLLAPLDAPVIPLPHQIYALERATRSDPVRMLLADEVGLGKTIEAGLVIRELKLRGQARRILVVAPKGLVSQWVAEMDTHFGEAFELVLPSERAAQGRSRDGTDLWRMFDQVVTSMDSIKPLASREGWSPRQVAAYNRDRFEGVTQAGWDLIVVDEAHRLAGASEGVARYELAQGLAAASPHLLLLSATPHSGKSDAFYRLMSLLDDRAFPSIDTITRERVQPYVVRTEKRKAVDADEQPLFVPRVTRALEVAWSSGHVSEQQLYEAVTDYVREGYAQAIRERRYAVGFLMVLFQRLVTSSTRAIRRALERRLAVLGGEVQRAALASAENEEGELDPDQVLMQVTQATANERAEVQFLLEVARNTEALGPDAKAETLLDLILELESQELDPNLKVVVFTEFTATQDMLEEFFTSRGYSVATLNGSMDLDERRRVQREFAGETRILVSTEAGGEGLNLQFCNVVANYDLPWNPMRIEQRIGRVDRIGQRRPVRAYNLRLESSVENRVQEVLERKLQQILDDLGVDKLSDVLDSGEAGADFERLYLESLLNPERLDSQVGVFAEDIRRRAEASRSATTLLTPEEDQDLPAARSVIEHPLRRWVETLTLNAVQDRGGTVTRRSSGYDLTWPDGERWTAAAFDRSALEQGAARLVGLSESRLQVLLSRGWRQVEGQPVPRVAVSGLVTGVEGVWSLWQMTATGGVRAYRHYLPLFLHDEGNLLIPSARRVWDLLSSPGTDLRVTGELDREEATQAWQRLQSAAESQIEALYREVQAEHREWLEREREKLRTNLRSRRAQADRIGLEAVRQHRLDQLEVEQRRREEELRGAEVLLADVSALVLVHVEPSNG